MIIDQVGAVAPAEAPEWVPMATVCRILDRSPHAVKSIALAGAIRHRSIPGTRTLYNRADCAATGPTAGGGLLRAPWANSLIPRRNFAQAGPAARGGLASIPGRSAVRHGSTSASPGPTSMPLPTNGQRWSSRAIGLPFAR